MSDPTAPPTTPSAGHDPQRHHAGMTFGGRLRAYLLAGILVTAPVAITVYIARMVISGIDGLVAAVLPAPYNPETLLPFWIPGVGVLVVLAFLVLVGMFTAGYVGRLVVKTGESIVARMPVIRGIYGAAKQIFETVLSKKSNSFRECVLVEFPRRGAWTVGFITGEPKGEVGARLPPGMLTVYVPTTPNPTGGYMLYVPEEEVQRLAMTVEEGLKLIVSMGIVIPADRQTAAALPPPGDG
ncbi:MAG TPA: DUF502 domain-containing protein [Azospirillaceae bacterium]|nr:DUF502 domain-containing protein [Azospirillaceae bacterium]